jgi:hypothetical protein
VTLVANISTIFASVVDTGGKFATGVNDTCGKFATGVNSAGGKLPPVSTTPVANLPPVSTISGCRNPKVILKAKIYIYVNSTTQRCPNKIIITINVPLFKKLRDIIFLWDNNFMSHFEGHFEGAKTFLTP